MVGTVGIEPTTSSVSRKRSPTELSARSMGCAHFFAARAASFLIILFALTRGAGADDLATVRIGTVGSMTEAPFYIADKKGYFRDEGLAVSYIPFDSAANMVAPLGAGQLDVGGGAPSAGLYNAVARGIDVRAVADLGRDTPGYGFQELLVRTELVKSGAYKTYADLRGKTIAVAGQGATAYAALSHLLARANLTYNDVKLVYMDYADQVVALKNGSIDASLFPEPSATLAVRTGAAIKITGDDAFYPNQQIAVVIYGSNFLKAHRELGLKFMRAYLRAARFYATAHKGGKLAGPGAEEVIDILTASTRIKDPAVYRAVVPNGNNPNGEVNLASMRDDLATYRAGGLVPGNGKPEDVVDGTFVAEALKTLGTYRGR
jgi:NitT/TauT family transport system substrate-binding protein